jgi:hypothetical protein
MDLIVLIIFGEDYKLLLSIFCSLLLHLPWVQEISIKCTYWQGLLWNIQHLNQVLVCHAWRDSDWHMCAYYSQWCAYRNLLNPWNMNCNTVICCRKCEESVAACMMLCQRVVVGCTCVTVDIRPFWVQVTWSNARMFVTTAVTVISLKCVKWLIFLL